MKPLIAILHATLFHYRASRRAVRFIRDADYLFVRRHEWRGFSLDTAALWPHVTIGWKTWDTLPEQIGQRQAEQLDVLRRKP